MAMASKSRMPSETALAVMLGAKDFIVKPFRPDEFRRIVREPKIIWSPADVFEAEYHATLGYGGSPLQFPAVHELHPFPELPLLEPVFVGNLEPFVQHLEGLYPVQAVDGGEEVVLASIPNMNPPLSFPTICTAGKW